MNTKQNLMVLGFLATLTIPTFSQAGECADIKERYWRCTRASMIGEECAPEDNVTIPAECLGGNTQPKKNTPPPAAEVVPSKAPSFFDSKSKSNSKENSLPKTESSVKKAVKIVNIKPSYGKVYFETEEEVDKYTTKIKEDILNGIKEGKKVRLQFQ